MTIPIPHRPSGFLLGDVAAQITIEAFIDIQCPHSCTIWPTLFEVSKYYQGKPVNIRVHLITLSNHRQAWDLLKTVKLFFIHDCATYDLIG
jgi:protein-disulfide isomerase